ncbi:hypothetical protein RJD11_12090 [Bacillus velezensis]|uniref:hypothetical protein n=1 Tax=Bacillus TaxID=1386 RepID=UPI001C5329EC|nr:MULTISPECIES: hypothetical protein [Bacillus amyloliquefaciens group]QXP99324.1 hypothetical protein KVY05_21415 [Bacillus velezensis]UHH01332.1 hypothetical protein LUA14_12015 [Bacillus amyloliquefaciens]ULR21080.1 hypothetical protein MJE83_12015 [Bacillus velezensis]UVW07823.1 hypothetical protein NX856_12055 [Bacillus velezensis]WHL75129.1 hypothetical protein QLH34_12035 [Bacillus velezensis]
MKINIRRIERLEVENVYNGDCLLTSFAFGMKVEAIIEFDSGNRSEVDFEFPKATDFSFAEAERMIRKELSDESDNSEGPVSIAEAAANLAEAAQPGDIDTSRLKTGLAEGLKKYVGALEAAARKGKH